MPRRLPDTVRARSLGLRLSLAALVAAALFAATAPDGPDDSRAQDLSVMLADGTLAHDNSRDGAAILSAGSVWPGWSGQGEVTITNSGSAGSWLRLTEAAVDDLPGPHGGTLSDRMALVVEDATVPDFPVPVYSGTLGAVGERWLGRMEPGEARTYRFRTRMPSGLDDNDYQASAVSVRFDWTVSDTEPVAPTPPVGPPAEQPAAEQPPAEQPPAEQPPAENPPLDDVQIVPDGRPVVQVTRRSLSVKLAVPGSQRPLRTGYLLTLASCSRGCRATFGGSLGVAKAGSSGHRIGRVSRALSAGIKSRVRLRIRPATLARVRRALRRGRAVRGRIRIGARDRHGRSVRASQRIRLVAPRGR